MDGDGRFFVRFWGVRGSIACPGEDTLGYGGNTPCLEIRCDGRLLIVDAGTGLRGLDAALAGPAPLAADILFTHTHLDHIWGWPFFTRLLRADSRLTVWAGNLAPQHRVAAVLDGLLDEPFTPVRRETLRAAVRYRDFRAGEGFALAPDLHIQTAPLNHPQGATGYRIAFAGKSICVVTDTEHVPGRPDTAILGLIDGADLVIYDCTYTDEEFARRRGWGHSTWQEGVRLCEAAGAGRLVVFHHDPGHDDRAMDRIAAAAEALRPGTVVAREGMTLAP